MEEKVKPFDWTFTTDYMGTMSGFEIEETDERINVENLKRKDKILFYVDLTLFEDELHDNGIAASSIKMVILKIYIFFSLFFIFKCFKSNFLFIKIRPRNIYLILQFPFFLGKFGKYFLYFFLQRVMPTSFFILLRYFLRIDNVMLRVNDTRIYHEFGDNYLLREFTSKEAKVQDIRVWEIFFFVFLNIIFQEKKII